MLYVCKLILVFIRTEWIGRLLYMEAYNHFDLCFSRQTFQTNTTSAPPHIRAVQFVTISHAIHHTVQLWILSKFHSWCRVFNNYC